MNSESGGEPGKHHPSVHEGWGACTLCDFSEFPKEQQPAAESVKPKLFVPCTNCMDQYLALHGQFVQAHRRIADQDAKIVDLQSQNVVLAQNALDRSFRIMELEEQSRISSEMLTSRWERIADLERQLKEAHEKKIVR